MRTFTYIEMEAAFTAGWLEGKQWGGTWATDPHAFNSMIHHEFEDFLANFEKEPF